MNILLKLKNTRAVCHFKDLHGVRTLFTPETLGITAYVANRELELTYTVHPEQFKIDFQKQIEQAVPLNILIDNLKRYIHLLSDRRDDIELLWKALRLYKTQHDQWKRKSQLDEKKEYTFGPITMRALSYHDSPEFAMKFFDDDNITELFDQLFTYQVFLDLLYDRKLYGDVLRLYAEIRKRIAARNQTVPGALNAIVFATYYRLNSEAHDELAYDLYKELKETGLLTKQYRKSIALVAAMRLKQHQPEQSLEILSIYDDIDVNIRYVRMLSNLYLNRFDEVFRLLKMTTIEKAPKIPDQLLQKIENQIRKHRDENLSKRYESILNELKRLDRILFKSFHDVLCARFPTKMAPFKPNKNFGHGNFKSLL